MRETYQRYEVIGYTPSGKRVTFVVKSEGKWLPGNGSTPDDVEDAMNDLHDSLDRTV